MNNSVKLIFKIIISVALLAWLASQLDLDAIWHRLRQVPPGWVALACLCMFFGQFVCAVRWAWLARGLGITIDMFLKVRLYFLGIFLSLFLPSIVGGDVARAYLLARDRQGQGWNAAASVVIERINGICALTILASLCMLFMSLPETWLLAWLVAVVVLWLAILTYDYWSSYLPRVLSAWKALPISTPEFHKAWWRSLPISFLFQVLVIQAHMFLAIGAGLELSWATLGFIVGMVALASAVPVSFNGFGIRETGYVGLASYFGGSSDAAAAMAVLWVLVLAIVAIPGGIVLWRLGGTRALRRVEESGS